MSFQTTAALTVFAAVGLAIGAAVVPPAVLGAGAAGAAGDADAVVESIEADCGVTLPSSEIGDGRLIDPGRPALLGDGGELAAASDGTRIVVSDVHVTKTTARFFTDYELAPFCEVDLPQR